MIDELKSISLTGRLCYLFMCIEKYFVSCYPDRDWMPAAKKCWQWTKGFWKPLENSHPYNGEKGEICSGCEAKMEVRCSIEQVQDAIRVIKEKHPYEEPVINVIPLLNMF